MYSFKKVLPILAIGLFVLGFVPEVAACSCFTAPAVDVELAHSENVIVARLEEFHELSRFNEGDRIYRTIAVAFTVERVFKGGLKASETIKVLDGADEGTCAMGFLRRKIGDRFLFYLGKPGGLGAFEPSLYRVGICGRSKPAERASADLAYLENLDSRRGQTRLSGSISASGETTPLPSVEGLKLELSGQVKRSTTTGANGFFEFWDLPVGEYSLSNSLPNGWKVRAYTVAPTAEPGRGRRLPKGGSIRAPITPRAHTEINIYLSIDNQISGTVFSRKGKPVKDVCVSAYWLTPTSSGFRIPGSCTDEQGKFQIEELPPGKYRLEITPNKGRSKPAKTFYYPGVYEKDQAEAVTVDAGKSVTGLEIRLVD